MAAAPQPASIGFTLIVAAATIIGGSAILVAPKVRDCVSANSVLATCLYAAHDAAPGGLLPSAEASLPAAFIDVTVAPAPQPASVALGLEAPGGIELLPQQSLAPAVTYDSAPIGPQLDLGLWVTNPAPLANSDALGIVVGPPVEISAAPTILAPPLAMDVQPPESQANAVVAETLATGTSADLGTLGPASSLSEEQIVIEPPPPEPPSTGQVSTPDLTVVSPSLTTLPTNRAAGSLLSMPAAAQSGALQQIGGGTDAGSITALPLP